jgi:RNA polymerase sigma-70 factor (ECF subfamily)
MDPHAAASPSEISRLLLQVAAGDQDLWGRILTQHRERLRCMVALRLDRRLQGRIDPSDVLQEAFLAASLQLPDYLRDPAIPLYLWLRLITGQQLVALHRRHLGAQARDAGREVALYRGALPQATSTALAARLLGREPRPREAAMQAERAVRLQQALDTLDPLDREVPALRHFEQLSNAEAAQILGLREAAASKRYVRALQRLKEVLGGRPGDW